MLFCPPFYITADLVGRKALPTLRFVLISSSGGDFECRIIGALLSRMQLAFFAHHLYYNIVVGRKALPTLRN